VKTINDREQKGDGFTAAGSCDSDKVATRERGRNRERLNWGRCAMSSVADRLQYYR
jgi:hypothetical protein